MKRVMCIRLPDWPLQRLRRGRPELRARPLVLYGRAGRGGFRVVTASAEARGVAPGLPLAEAKAVLPAESQTQFVRLDPEADRAALADLAEWALRFAPYAGVEESDAPDSLLVDLDGVTHLWGGEEGTAARVARELKREGYAARVAAADTIGAAWAVTHYSPAAGRRPVVVPPGEQRGILSGLPVEALRLPGDVVERLHALGLRQAGQLLGLPRESLPSRFTDVLTCRLDQALGRAAEIFVPRRPAEPVEAAWEFEHPAGDRGVLGRVCGELLGRVAARLSRRREGVLRLWLGLDVVGDGGAPAEPVNVAVELVEPRACPRHLRELLTLRLERVTLPAEVSRVRLIVTQTAPLAERQRELFDVDPEKERERHLSRLVDRLSSRLGPQAVLRPRLAEDHQPECAARLRPVVQERPEKLSRRRRKPAKAPAAPELPCSLSRPLRLLRPTPVDVLSVFPDGPPERLAWRGRSHVVSRHEGPERVETGWWRSKDVRRDYYRVETADGRRFWLFKDITEGTWHLHGIFE